MEMMYGKIAQAIAEEGLDAHPRDYLNFYCLGVREPLQPDDQVGPCNANVS
jgi:phospholipase D1/2